MSTLSVGKIRGLQQIADNKGLFIISAIDHRGSFQKMISEGQGKEATYEDMVERKQELCSVLTPYSSAVLLDPQFGAAQCIAGGSLPGNKGLLISIEETGYETTPGGRLTTLLEGWGVEKIKRMGGSAVKILVYYRPDLIDIRNKQLETIRFVADECIKYDIPFLVEPVAYPIEGEAQDSPEYAAKKSKLVIETARQITELPIDILKAEFPVDLNFEKDEEKVLDICRQLNDASRVPWIILSAGVGFEIFARQVELACRSGASGFLGGRATWKESMKMGNKQERMKFLTTTVVERARDLRDITTRCAVPWYQKYGLPAHGLMDIPENWYTSY
jgi:tagatose 1,6-diphosphate aldolase